MQSVVLFTKWAWRWLWLVVAALLAVAAKKEFSRQKQLPVYSTDLDSPMRVRAFAMLFLLTCAIVTSRAMSIILFERHRSLPLIALHAAGRWLHRAASIGLHHVCESFLGKVLVGLNFFYATYTLGSWCHKYLTLEIIYSTIRLVGTLINTLDCVQIAAAAEEWIQAWFLRNLIALLRDIFSRQMDLIETQPLYSLAFMAAMIGVCTLAAFAVEFVTRPVYEWWAALKLRQLGPGHDE
jgi:hypothetical protein